MSSGFRIGVGGVVITQREKDYVMDVLSSGRLSAGPYMHQFESAFASLHDCQYALMCNSGTGALHVALAAMKEYYGWKDGDEVLVPAVTFVASANVVLQNGLEPVFVDVDPLTYTMDPADAVLRVTSRTRAMMPVHVMGLPCDMATLMEIASLSNLAVVEDSCETVCARYRGQSVGSFGQMGCFSTYMAHLFVTGVGGLITTNHDELAVIMKSLINHGRDSIYLCMDDDNVDDPDQRFRIADRRFSFVRLGYSYRATEMEAALGVAQLERRGEILAHHQRVAHQLIDRLQPLSDRIQLPSIPADRDHMFMAFPIVLRDPLISRDDLIWHLEAEGIETRYLLPLLTQPVYQSRYGDLSAQYPVATHVARRGFYIGCHQEVTDVDVDHIVTQFFRFFMEH